MAQTDPAEPEKSLFDPEGFPWLENGERMDQKTFHERYEQTPPGFKAELIGGIVYVMSSPLSLRHARSDSDISGWLFNYRIATPGTMSQTNATTILGEESEPQPDSALLILEDYGGQSRDGADDYTHGAPELIVEVALSSRSVDLNGKLRDYEQAGAREYIVYELKAKRRPLVRRTRTAGSSRSTADPDGLCPIPASSPASGSTRPRSRPETRAP